MHNTSLPAPLWYRCSHRLQKGGATVIIPVTTGPVAGMWVYGCLLSKNLHSLG